MPSAFCTSLPHLVAACGDERRKDVGEGQGGGSMDAAVGDSPHPCPPPQGGRE
jgi:hypothetical protein